MARAFVAGAVALALLAACGETPELSPARIAVALPQTAAIDYTRVTAVQGGVEIEGEVTPDDPLVTTFTVDPGVPLDVSALVFDATTMALLGYLGSRTITPEPGRNVVELDTTAFAARSVRIVPAFDDATPLVVAIPLDVEDEETGALFPDAFVTGVHYGVPAERALIVRGVHPISHAPVEVRLEAGDPVDDVVLEVGSPPVLPAGALVGNGVTALDAAGVAGDSGYTLECAFSTSCSEAAFGPCADLVFPGDPTIEGTFPLLVRYQEAPQRCTTLAYVHDTTRPRGALTASPAFLDTGAPRQVDVTLTADEPMAPASVSLRELGDPAATELCPAPVVLGPSSLSCPAVDLTVAAQSPASLFAEARDLAGNPFSAHVSVRIRDVDLDPALVQVLAVRTLPSVPDPTDYGIVTAIDVVNTGAADVCGVYAGGALHSPGGSMTSFLGTAADVPVLAGGGAATVWGRIDSEVPSGESGVFTLDLQLSWSDCMQVNDQGASSWPLYMELPQLRWLTNGVVTLSALFGQAPLPSPPTELPLVYSNTFFGGEPFTLSVPAGNGVLQVAAGPRGAATLLVPIGLGSTVVRAQSTQNPTEDSVVVEVVAAPSLLMLEGDARVAEPRLHRRGGGIAAEETRLSPAIGVPQAVLWESMRDRILVVGSDGVQLVGEPGQPVIADPCGGLVRGAALTAAAPGHRNPLPDLALLVDVAGTATHCELDPTSGAGVPLISEPLPGLCSVPPLALGPLIADPVTGELTALGYSDAGSCVMRYDTRTAAVRPLASPSLGLSGPITEVAYDPFIGASVVATTNQTASLLLGGDAPFAGSEGLPFAPAAMAADPAYGGVFMSENNPLMGVPRLLYLFRRNGGYTGVDDFRSGEQGIPTLDVLAFDASNRQLFGTRSNPTPELLTVASMAFRDPVVGFNAVTPAILTDAAGATLAPIVDLTIQGPQALHLSRQRVAPDAVMTVTGTGFAGGGADRVFVAGIEAPVLGSTSTLVTFSVPAEFEKYPRIYSNAPITVLSHGRLSGPAAEGLQILRPAGPRSVFPGSAAATCAAGPCPVAVAPGPFGNPVVWSASFQVFPSGLFGAPDVITPPAAMPQSGALAANPTGLRTVVHDGSSLMFTRHYPDVWGWGFGQETEPFRQGPAASGAPFAAMAISPDDHTLAVATADGHLSLYWAHALASRDAPIDVSGTAAPVPARVAFSADSRTLVLVAGGGELAGVDLTSLSTFPIAAGTAGCPPAVSSRRVLAAAPGLLADEVLVLTHESDAQGGAFLVLGSVHAGAYACEAFASAGDVRAGAISPDAEWVATASFDGVATYVIEAWPRDLSRKSSAYTSSTVDQAVTFSVDGSYIYAAGDTHVQQF